MSNSAATTAGSAALLPSARTSARAASSRLAPDRTSQRGDSGRAACAVGVRCGWLMRGWVAGQVLVGVRGQGVGFQRLQRQCSRVVVPLDLSPPAARHPAPPPISPPCRRPAAAPAGRRRRRCSASRQPPPKRCSPSGSPPECRRLRISRLMDVGDRLVAWCRRPTPMPDAPAPPLSLHHPPMAASFKLMSSPLTLGGDVSAM
jgi:hypothetical protein